MKNYKNLAKYVETLIDALDDLKMASKKCVQELEVQRRNMYAAAKKMIMLRDGIRQ